MRPEDLILYCGGCDSFRCTCPKRRTNRYIDRIETKKVKARKYVTKIYGELDPADFPKLKENLGTGGTLYTDRFEIRGTVETKTLDVLEKLGYTISKKLRDAVMDYLKNIEKNSNKQFGLSELKKTKP